MSQPLSNLAEGTRINIVETINNRQYTVPMLIIANNKNYTNPYGSDATLCLRYRLTGAAGTGTLQDYDVKYGSSSTSVEYENSTLDTFMNNEWINRLDDATKACIKTSTITCYSISSAETYYLQRKAFALSNKESGGTSGTDTSTNIGYFTNNASRTAYDSTGHQSYRWWTRSPYSASAVWYIEYGDAKLYTSSPTSSSYRARPACNFMSSALVSDTPNADGTYDLLSSSNHLKSIDFECLISETPYRVSRALIDFAYVCDGEDADLQIQLCNNYNDDTPTWENADYRVSHIFINQTKTSNSWALGLKLHAESDKRIYIYEPCALVLMDTPGGAS